jgi:hypothetical protein
MTSRTHRLLTLAVLPTTLALFGIGCGGGDEPAETTIQADPEAIQAGSQESFEMMQSMPNVQMTPEDKEQMKRAGDAAKQGGGQ